MICDNCDKTYRPGMYKCIHCDGFKYKHAKPLKWVKKGNIWVVL